MTQTAILFDLDGTLIDSAPDLHGAAARMLEAEGLAPLPFETIRSFIGNGVPKLVERIIDATGLEQSDHPRLVAAFLETYNAHATDLTRPYHGVMDALARLQVAGHAMGVVTNKPEAPARAILEALGMEAFFAVVVGGDTMAVKKPDPMGLNHAITELGARAVLYVGDSEVDAETAQAADVPFALYAHGYAKTPHAQIPHHILFDHFDALPGLAEELLMPHRLA